MSVDDLNSAAGASRDATLTYRLSRTLGASLGLLGGVLMLLACLTPPPRASVLATVIVYGTLVAVFLLPGLILLMINGGGHHVGSPVGIVVCCGWLLLTLGLDMVGGLWAARARDWPAEGLARVVADGLTLLAVIKLTYHAARVVSYRRRGGVIGERAAPPQVGLTPAAATPAEGFSALAGPVSLATIVFNCAVAASAAFGWRATLSPAPDLARELAHVRGPAAGPATPEEPYVRDDLYDPKDGLPADRRRLVVALVVKIGLAPSYAAQFDAALREAGAELVGRPDSFDTEDALRRMFDRWFVDVQGGAAAPTVRLPRGTVVLRDGIVTCYWYDSAGSRVGRVVGAFYVTEGVWRRSHASTEQELDRLAQSLGRPIDRRQAEAIRAAMALQRLRETDHSDAAVVALPPFITNAKLSTAGEIEADLGGRHSWVTPDGTISTETFERRRAAVEARVAADDYPRDLPLSPWPFAGLLACSACAIGAAARLRVAGRGVRDNPKRAIKARSLYAGVSVISWFAAMAVCAVIIGQAIRAIHEVDRATTNALAVTVALIVMAAWGVVGIFYPVKALRSVSPRDGENWARAAAIDG